MIGLPGRIVTSAALAALSASALHAQDDVRGRRGFELSGGVVWTGNASFGDQPATETPLTGDRFQLFSTSTRLAPTVNVAAGLGIGLTRTLDVDATASYGRPRLRTLIGSDAEGAADVTAEETIQRVDISAGVRWRMSRWRLGGRAEPFVSGGAGYLRELHEGATLAVTGQTIHAGLGVDLPFVFGSGQSRGAGIRGEGRVVLRRKGAGFDSSLHAFPAVAASVFFRF